MKKKILALVIGALAFSTIGAFAQSETSQKTPVQKEAKCCKEKKDKDGHHNGKDRKKGHGERINPFDGIQLSAEQQKKIEDLRAERRSQREADTTKAKEARKAQREEYNKKLTEILTPEQMAQYKTNCESIKARKHQKGSKERAEKRKHKTN